MRKGTVVSWNKDYVRGLTKSNFTKEFEKIYPDVDLSAEYDKIVPRKKSKKDDHGEDLKSDQDDII